LYSYVHVYKNIFLDIAGEYEFYDYSCKTNYHEPGSICKAKCQKDCEVAGNETIYLICESDGKWKIFNNTREIYAGTCSSLTKPKHASIFPNQCVHPFVPVGE